MKSLCDQLDRLQSQAMKRILRVMEAENSGYVACDDRRSLLLCSNNYLGLASHPLLKEGAIRATQTCGTGTGASRLVSGTTRLHIRVEEALAAWKQTEGALLFNSGFAANTAILPALAGADDLIFSDALNHASIVDGCRLSRARVRVYPHKDMATLAAMMEEEKPHRKGRWLVVTDGVFSMDGDQAPLPELVQLKQKYDTWLMVDDAHGAGVLGEKGQGTAAAMGCHDAIDLQMGTLGKALGGFGAYLCAARPVLDFLVNHARPFIFSTSLPPAVLGAAEAAVALIQTDEGDRRRQRLKENTRLFIEPLRAAGLNLGPTSTQIVPILTGEPESTMRATDHLLQQGYFIQGIRPPTVPVGACRLRATLMADHPVDMVVEAAQAVVRCLQENLC